MRQPIHRRRVGAQLWTLWMVVSGLWTLATLLRINRVWVPLSGWHRIVDGPWLWSALLLPPLTFAAILAVIHRNITGKQ